MASTPKTKAKGRKLFGRKFFVALVCLGVLMVLFGILWLAIFWPTMKQLSFPMDEHVWQEGYFQEMNPQTGQFIDIPVKDDIHIWGNVTVGGAVFVHQTHTFYDNSPNGTGEVLPYVRDQVLAVDRKTGIINPALNQYPVGMSATGYMQPPRGLKAGATFSIFLPSTETFRVATYVRDDIFHYGDRDIKVVVFRQDYKEVPCVLPGYPTPGIITGNTTYWIEPKSGMILDVYADEVIDMVVQGHQMPVFKNQIYYSDSTIEDMIDNADKINTMFPLMGVILPWLGIGLGIVFAIAGTVLYMRRGKQA